MSLWTTVPFRTFGGLDLASSPTDAVCIDQLNVELDVRGTIRARDGLALKATQANTTLSNLFACPESSGASRLLASVDDNGTDQLEARNLSGTVVASVDLTTGGAQYFAPWGDPSASYVYITDPGTTIRRYVPATDTFSQPAGMPDGVQYLGVQPNDNRLVAAGRLGTSSGDSPSTVKFSDEGAPETWTSTSFVELTPGDGEDISGICSYRDYLIVFKRTKFFVFYGNSVDQTGEPVFNYRAVDTGIGLAHEMALAVAPEGVYFVADDGVYLTSGGTPRKVSAAIDPQFGVGSMSTYAGVGSFPAAGNSPPRLAYFGRRLYVAFTATLNSPRCWVFDPQLNAWMYWQIPYLSTCQNNGLSHADGTLYLGTHRTSGSGTLNIYSFSADTDDAGTAIASHYRTGFYDLGLDVEKRLRQMTVWGTGEIDLTVSRDFGSLDTERTLTMGTSPAIDRATTNCAKDGYVISHQFAATDAWTLYRSVLEFMPRRPPGAKTP